MSPNPKRCCWPAVTRGNLIVARRGQRPAWSNIMNAAIKPLLAAATFLLACPNADAQHLWWDLEGQRDATCVYGEITVLATHPGIYYCGINWHPGEPAGGYCGIQHNGPKEKRTIFSIWDTTTDLHPKVTRSRRQHDCSTALAAKERAGTRTCSGPGSSTRRFNSSSRNRRARRQIRLTPAIMSTIVPQEMAAQRDHQLPEWRQKSASPPSAAA